LADDHRRLCGEDARLVVGVGDAETATAAHLGDHPEELIVEVVEVAAEAHARDRDRLRHHRLDQIADP